MAELVVMMLTLNLLHMQARDAQARERAAEERGRRLEEQRYVSRGGSVQSSCG